MNRRGRNDTAGVMTAAGVTGAILLFLCLLPALSFSQSQTCGIQWNAPVRISVDSVPSISARIAVTGDTVHLLWYGLDTIGGLTQTGIQYSRSTDGGLTFSAERTLLPLQNAFTPGVLAASGRYVYVAGLAAIDTFYGTVVLRSDDAGLTWGSPQFVLRLRQAEGIIASDSLVFLHHSNFLRNNYGFLRSSDFGGHWQQFGSFAPHLSSLAIHGRYIEGIGEVGGTYVTEIGYYSNSLDGSYWFGPEIISTDDLTPSLQPSIAATETGELYASWTDTGVVVVRTSRNDGLSWLPQTVFSTRKNAITSAIAAGSEFVVGAWDNDFGGTGAILVRSSNDYGQSYCAVDSPTTAARVGGPAITIVRNKVHLAWSETVGGDEEIFYRSGALTYNPDLVDHPPAAYALFQNYPNPFNGSTHIRYDLPTATSVRLSLYNILGQEVLRLVDGVQDRNRYDVFLDGGALATGVYFYRLSTSAFTEIKKLMIVH